MLKKLWFMLLLAVIALPVHAEEAVQAVEEELPYLLTVAASGDMETLNAMLQAGTNPNTKDADGITALMYAARKDQVEAARALLKSGAKVNAQDSGGWTPLMFAAKKNHVATAKLLLNTEPTPRCGTAPAGAPSAWQPPPAFRK